MIDTGYHFIYRLPGTKDLVVIKHDKYKLERINDKIEEFVLSDLAYPNQIAFLGLLEKSPHLILDIYLSMNSDKYDVAPEKVQHPLDDYVEELFKEDSKEESIIEIESDYE